MCGVHNLRHPVLDEHVVHRLSPAEPTKILFCTVFRNFFASSAVYPPPFTNGAGRLCSAALRMRELDAELLCPDARIAEAGCLRRSVRR